MLYRSHDFREHRCPDNRIYGDVGFLPHVQPLCEAVLVLEGELAVTVGSRTEIAKKGDGAIILGNQLHSYSTESSSRAWICVFPEELSESFVKALSGKEGECSVFRCPREALSYFHYLESGENGIDEYAERALIYMLCSEFFRQTELVDGAGRGEELFYRIVSYISRHYREDVTLTGIAAELGYEPHYLSRFFHKTADINLKKLINQYRVSYAIELLERGELEISAVSAECGFKSVRNFNRVFLAETGKVPGELLGRKSDATKA